MNLLLLLITTAQLQTTNWVLLGWDPNPTNENVTAYNIYYRTNNGVFTKYSSTTNTEGYVSNLIWNATYWFAVTAYNDVGESDFSETVRTTVGFKEEFPLIFEAELAELSGPILTVYDSAASGGAYITPTQNNQGTATFEFNVSTNGLYAIWGLAKVLVAEPLATDSFFWSVDGSVEFVWSIFFRMEAVDHWRWDALSSFTGEPADSYVSPHILQLNKGDHTFVIRGRESRTMLDKILITDDLKFDPRVTDDTEIPQTTGLRVIQWK